MKRLFLVAIALCVCTMTLGATLIDFTQASFSSVDGQPTATIAAAGYTITLTAEHAWDVTDWEIITPVLSHETGSGIGVYTGLLGCIYDGNPEIEVLERLRIQANPGLAIYGFTLSSLYLEGSPAYNEKAQYRVNLGEWKTAIGGGSGFIPVTLGDPLTGVTTLEFKASCGKGCQQHDFMVANLEVAQVPEPATFPLLIGTLVVAGVIYRRRGSRARP